MSRRILSLLPAILSFSITTEATTFLASTDEQKMADATQICAVEVIGLSTENFAPSPQARGMIRTKAHVKTMECYKGPEAESFDVVWPGGQIEAKDKKGKTITRIASVPGTPQLKKGDRALLYLWRKNPTDAYTVHSWSQGVIPLEFNRERNEYRLSRPLMMGSYREQENSAHAPSRSASRSFGQSTKVSKEAEKVNLSDFGSKVRGALERAR